jgi:hypothetical protein
MAPQVPSCLFNLLEQNGFKPFLVDFIPVQNFHTRYPRDLLSGKYRGAIHAFCDFKKTLGTPAENRRKHVEGKGCELPDFQDVETGQPGSGNFTHAGKKIHRQRRKERFFIAGEDKTQVSRADTICGNLAYQLVRSKSDPCTKPHFPVQVLFHPAGQVRSWSPEAVGTGNIYEITSRVAPFYQRRKDPEFPDYVPVFFPVMIKIRRHYMNPAAQAASPAKRQALPDALFSGIAVYTLDNGSLASLRQNEGAPLQFRLPQFLDCRIKIGNSEMNYIPEHKFRLDRWDMSYRG